MPINRRSSNTKHNTGYGTLKRDLGCLLRRGHLVVDFNQREGTQLEVHSLRPTFSGGASAPPTAHMVLSDLEDRGRGDPLGAIVFRGRSFAP